MARWHVTPKTGGNTMTGKIDYDDKDSYWSISQDTDQYLAAAKEDRETLKTTDGYKKFATIPDIVALDIKVKYGIDIHEPTFFHDVDKKARFMLIVKQEYPHLLSY